MTNNKWILTVKEDPETGDAILELPPDLIEAAGWKEGDTLNWKEQANGSWLLTKRKEDEMTVLSEYINTDANRTAIVYKQGEDYGAHLCHKGEVMLDRKCVGHNLQYVEDLAENWINQWGEFNV